MTTMNWAGVMPAITTPFADDRGDAIDHAFLAEHAGWLVDHGCTGVIALGSLGEGATLEPGEKRAVLETLVAAVGPRVPVVAAVSALATGPAVALARDAERIGCRGLMVLPPYVHQGEHREIRTHFDAVLGATALSCMVYNNPIAYGTDLRPPAIAELAEAWPALHAVKESGGDVRRVTAVKALCGDRLAVFAGLDDMVVEACACGATGWVAGLVNALPAESVELFRLAHAGELTAAHDLYRWFLPLLRLDTVPEFVQLIKLVQQEVGHGSERVRPPRLPLADAARADALAVIRAALAARPRLVGRG